MKNIKSLSITFLIGVIYLFSIWLYKPNEPFYRQDGGDAFGYYVYLPSFFIYHDLPTMQATMTAKYNHSQPGRKGDSTNPNKYFIGTAVLQAPFFLASHVLAKYVHQEQDGFSMIYMYGVQVSAAFYAMAALFIMMLVLRRRFSDGVVAVVILLLGLGTNIYYMVTVQGPFSHPYLFFWYAMLVYFTQRFYDKNERKYIPVIGLICGMIIVTRFNELYVVLIPIVWGLKGKDDIVTRFRLFKENILSVIGAGIIMALCLLPQLLYWRASSGHFFYYSYQGESFDFRHPHIWDGFFSFGNGWLVYCPILFVALAGIVLTFKRRDPAASSLIVFLCIHIYVIYCWWCYYYMGSYGSRPMTEAYPLLAIPMGYSIEWLNRALWRKIFITAFSALCIFIIIQQSYLSSRNLFNSELSNWRYNVVTFGKFKVSYEESVVLNTNEFQPHDPNFVKVLKSSDFEDPSLPGSDSTVATSGRRSLRDWRDSTLSLFGMTLRESGASQGQWIKVSVNCLATATTVNNWHLVPMVIKFTRGNKPPKWKAIGLQNKIDNPNHEIWHFPVNQWGRIYFYSKVPSGMSPNDSIQVYIEHKYGPDVCVDDLKVELYEEK